MARKIPKVQVSNLSNEATEVVLIAFFSCCGTIDSIKWGRDGAESQKAIVTFSWPSAQEKALLLDGALMLRRIVWISSLYASDEESQMARPSFNEDSPHKLDEEVENRHTKCSQLQISYEELKWAKQQEAQLGLNNRGGVLGPRANSVIPKLLQSKHNGESATVKSSNHSAACLHEAAQLNSALVEKGKWIDEETYPRTLFSAKPKRIPSSRSQIEGKWIQDETYPPALFSAKPTPIFLA